MKMLKRYISPKVGLHTYTHGRPMRDFELATMILSAITYKEKVGPITLASDADGYSTLGLLGIVDLYDDFMFIEVDKRIDTKIFWAAGKIEALSRIGAPCISIDLDAVLCKSLSSVWDLHVFHTEPLNWEAYTWNPMWDHLSQLLNVPGWKRVAPYNTAIAAFFDDDLRREYCEASKLLMVRESANRGASKYAISVKGSGATIPVTEMVFAEQYTLAIMAQQRRSTVKCITALDVASDHPEPNVKAFHLWNSKRFYEAHGRARESYLSWVMEKIFSICMGTEIESMVQSIINKCDLPTIRVVDGNCGIVRWSRRGEWSGPGEEVTRL